MPKADKFEAARPFSQWVVAACFATVMLMACSEGRSTPGSSAAPRPSLEVSLRYPEAGLKEVHSLDIYVDGGVVHTLLAGTFAGRKTPVLRYLRSEDGGGTWSDPSEIKSDVAPPTVSRRGNDVQLAAFGEQIVAVWQTPGKFPGMGPMVSAFSGDGGRTWEPGSNPSAQGDQGYMDLVADRLGDFHLVWLDDREERGSPGLRYAKSIDGGRHWSPTLTLDDMTCTCCWTRLSVSPQGVLYVLYRDAEPHDMALAEARSPIMDWHRVGLVGDFNWHFTGCPHAGGGLAGAGHTDPLTLHSVVWTGNERERGMYYLRSSDGGWSWTPPMRLGDPQALHGDVAVLDPGRIAIVWDSLEAEDPAILASVSADGGQTWSAPQRLSAPVGLATHPRVVAFPLGFLALWTEQRPNGSRVWATARLRI
jgi:hypothetical protein